MNQRYLTDEERYCITTSQRNRLIRRGRCDVCDRRHTLNTLTYQLVTSPFLSDGLPVFFRREIS